MVDSPDLHYSPSAMAKMSGIDGGADAHGGNGCNGGLSEKNISNGNGVAKMHSRRDKDGGRVQQQQPSVLQQHIQFWDRDNDGIIWPLDVYRGFRELGFGLFFSIGSLLIPLFFSYPTRLGRSWLPDPALRILVSDIHRAKHGSDSGSFDLAGNFDDRRFEEMWRAGVFGSVSGNTKEEMGYDADDSSDDDVLGDYEDVRVTSTTTAEKTTKTKTATAQDGPGLEARDIYGLWRRHHCAADLAGWTFAAMEWWTTWVLLERNGKVYKEDLRACYDGSLFWNIREERERERERQKGILRGHDGRRRRSSSMRNFFCDLP
jgi:peroxygenase